MAVRQSNYNDVPTLKQLMNEVFGDDERFIHLFFKFFYQNNCLVYELENKIVAMAFLLPAEFSINCASHTKSLQYSMPVTYLYGCATAKSYQKQGFMTEIIHTAYNNICQNQEAGLFLRPATPTLFNYYQKLGFQNFFYNQTVEIETAHYKQFSSPYHLILLSPDEYPKWRKLFLQEKTAILWGSSVFSFIQQDTDLQQGCFFRLENDTFETKGCGFFYLKDTTIYIPEFLGDFRDSILGSLFIKRFPQIDNIKVTMSGTTECYGQIMLNPRFSSLLNLKGYFSFSLE